MNIAGLHYDDADLTLKLNPTFYTVTTDKRQEEPAFGGTSPQVLGRFQSSSPFTFSIDKFSFIKQALLRRRPSIGETFWMKKN